MICVWVWGGENPPEKTAPGGRVEAWTWTLPFLCQYFLSENC